MCEVAKHESERVVVVLSDCFSRVRLSLLENYGNSEVPFFARKVSVSKKTYFSKCIFPCRRRVKIFHPVHF